MSEEATVPGLSVLGSLKERRQQVVNETVLRLPVPRWRDPELVVVYKPVDHKYIRAAQDRVSKAPKERRYEAEVDGNADILIRGCVGVVAVVDGKDYSLKPGEPHAEPTLFDADLASNLGLDDAATAREVVRSLFIAEGDIISAAGALTQWSGYRETEADSTILGE